MAPQWPTLLLMFMKVAGTFAVSDNEDFFEMRLNKMEKDFFLSIQSLKSELIDTQDKLKNVQAELDSTKSIVMALGVELVGTQMVLKETRFDLRKTMTELIAIKSIAVDQIHPSKDSNEGEHDMEPDTRHTNEDATSYSRNQTSYEPESLAARRIQPKRLSVQSRVVSAEHTWQAFSVQTSHHDESLITHQTVLFPRVILNEGSAYDNLTGVFTCPESGVYHFSVTIMTFFNGEVETELVVNGNQVMLNYAGGNLRYNQGTNSVLVRLDVGDRVWVRILNNPTINKDGAINIHGQSWSTFAGFLIQS
ncbi:heavy metal-binding protein HIP-like [Argopecten irradians]|uniref:heavy metal-binding protein HIP-like n=1 Tax=Argopecten irradians TaxID=31199 RepID=UPI0037135730